jgi:hypothetical protein
MGKRSKMRPVEPVVEVWLVWDGEWEAVLLHVCATQAGAERMAHEARKGYGFAKDMVVTVDGPHIVQP